MQRWARRPKSSQQLALRSRIVLACAEGHTNTAVAELLGINKVTVGKWRARFVQDRLQGLTDEPRPGAPRTVTDEAVEQVVVRTLESKPVDATHWSTRSMAAATGMSQSAISRIWRAFGLKPHRQETFKLSTDPQFVDKVRDVVGLYMNPPEKALVLCVDEKTQVQALDRSQPVIPMMPGTPERITHDYIRAGTVDLFAALEVAGPSRAGDHPTPSPAPRDGVPQVPRHDRQERPDRLRRAPDRRQPVHPQDTGDPQMAPRPSPVPPALHPDRIVLAQPRRTLVRRDHHETHPPRRTPQRQSPRQGHHRLGRELEQQPPPYVWTKTADEILNTLAAYCQRITDSGH